MALDGGYLSIATSKWGQGRQTGNPSEYVFVCPNCFKRKLYVNIRTGRFLCFKCFPLVKGVLSESSSSFSCEFYDSSASESKRRGIECDWNAFSRPIGSLVERACWDYLVYERKLHVSLVEQFQLGWSHNYFAVSIPVTPGRNILRLLYNTDCKYLFSSQFKKSEVLFNYQRVRGKRLKRLYVFEGVFDVICAAPFASVAIFGSVLSERQAKLLASIECNEIVFCLDPDVSSEKVLENIANVVDLGLEERRFLRAILPPNTDPGSLGVTFEEKIKIIDWWDV